MFTVNKAKQKPLSSERRLFCWGRRQQRRRTLPGLVAPPADKPLHYPAGVGGGRTVTPHHFLKNLPSTTRWRLPDSGWRKFPLGWKTGLHLWEVEKGKLLQREGERSRRLTAIQPAKLTCCIRALQAFSRHKTEWKHAENRLTSSSGQTLAT